MKFGSYPRFRRSQPRTRLSPSPTVAFPRHLPAYFPLVTRHSPLLPFLKHPSLPRHASASVTSFISIAYTHFPSPMGVCLCASPNLQSEDQNGTTTQRNSRNSPICTRSSRCRPLPPPHSCQRTLPPPCSGSCHRPLLQACCPGSQRREFRRRSCRSLRRSLRPSRPRLPIRRGNQRHSRPSRRPRGPGPHLLPPRRRHHLRSQPHPPRRAGHRQESRRRSFPTRVVQHFLAPRLCYPRRGRPQLLHRLQLQPRRQVVRHESPVTSHVPIRLVAPAILAVQSLIAHPGGKPPWPPPKRKSMFLNSPTNLLSISRSPKTAKPWKTR